MEITKREILASVTIIAVMMILGIVIAGRIDAHQVQKNSEYYSALQITDTARDVEVLTVQSIMSRR